jgi:hypothetical protein
MRDRSRSGERIERGLRGRWRGSGLRLWLEACRSVARRRWRRRLLWRPGGELGGCRAARRFARGRVCLAGGLGCRCAGWLRLLLRLEGG